MSWGGWMPNFGIGKDNLPSFFVLDFPSQKHWVLEAKGGLRVWATQEVAEDTLAAFLVDVVEGKVPAKQPGLLGGMPAAIWTRVVDLWPWSLALLLPLGWIFAACLGGIAVVDKEEEELRGEGEGERPVGDAGEDDRLGAGKAAVSKKED
ncbi:hypothetical protein Naga_100440g4 [Nannochloropsis gaditana]|uniref:Uncharacterized protein n=1 Tax=Nannochloropsis gaditana TaxID=72520 RepID=W7TTT8_9STRA|nr:hypothetical protein Naga_100440g4 [Nannochloropsis gaditana]